MSFIASHHCPYTSIDKKCYCHRLPVIFIIRVVCEIIVYRTEVRLISNRNGMYDNKRETDRQTDRQT